MKYVVCQEVYDWGRIDLWIEQTETKTNPKRCLHLLKSDLYKEVFETLPEAINYYNKLLKNPYSLEEE